MEAARHNQKRPPIGDASKIFIKKKSDGQFVVVSEAQSEQARIENPFLFNLKFEVLSEVL
jgi:hypothetical protein